MYRTRWENLIDEMAAQEERSHRISAHGASLMKRWSKVSKRAERRQADVEEKMLKKMAEKMRLGHRFALTDIPPAIVADIVSPPLPGKRKKKSRYRVTTREGRLNREANKRIFLVPPRDPRGSEYVACFRTWDHIAPITRAMCYGMAIPAAQRFTLNLNLSPKVTKDALTSDKGFAPYLQDRLHRYMRNALPGQRVPDFVLVVEGYSTLQDLHLHGAINLTPNLARGADRTTIRNALKAAAGFKDDDAHSGNELDIRPIYEAAGWFRYLAKQRMVTAEKIRQARRRLGLADPVRKHHLIVATRPLRRAGQRWFENARETGRVVLWNDLLHPGGSRV